MEEILRDYLKTLGADLVGFADLKEVDPIKCNNMRYGISFGIKINPNILKGIDEGPTEEYYKEYNRLNKALDAIATGSEEYIKKLGYEALAQTTTYVTSDDNLTTLLPHKTVATRAGLGWIGKNALLITPEFGSGIRLSSVLTNMPLKADKAINESKCGKCSICSEACPASAIKGTLWNVGINREDLIEPLMCRQKARELMKERVGIDNTLCGKCIEACLYTRRYISESK